MRKEIKITRINHSNKTSKAGKAYISCGIMITSPDNTDYWLNGFGNDTTKSFSIGQTVELDIWQDDYGWKFKVPEGMQKQTVTPNPTASTTALEARIKALEVKVDILMLSNKKTVTEQNTAPGKYDIDELAKKLDGEVIK